MEKNRDSALNHGKDLDIQYAELLSKSKLMESDFKKEILKLKILFQSEKSKTSSLENSMKEYPSKVTALEQRLNEEIALRRSLEKALEKYSNDEESNLIAEKLQNYQQACAQLQSENASLNKKYLETLKDKEKLQQSLTEYIDFLNQKTEKLKEDHERAVEDLKFEENQKRLQENKELRKEIAHLSSKIFNKKEQFSRMSQKYDDSRDFQLKIALEVDKKESVIRDLKRQNEKLLEKSYFKGTEIPFDIDDICHNLEKLQTENATLKRTLKSQKEKSRKKKEALFENLENTTIQTKELNRSYTKLECEAKDLRAKVLCQNQTIQDLKNKLKDCEEEFNEIKEQAKQSVEPVMMKLRSERDSFKVQLEEVRKSVEWSSAPSIESSLFDELSSLKNQTPETLEIELSKTIEEKEELEVELTRTLEQKENLEIELTRALEEKGKLDTEIKTTNSTLSAKIALISELESEINELKAQSITIRVLNAQLSEKDETISEIQGRKKELKNELKKMNHQLTEKNEALKQLENEKVIDQKQLKSIETDLKQKETYIYTIHNKNIDLQKEIDLLQKLNSKIIKKNLEVATVPDAETEIRISDYSTKITEESFYSKNSEDEEANFYRFQSEILEKESLISNLKKEIDHQHKEIEKLQKENMDLLSQNQLQVVHPKYIGKKGIAAILELESERDMFKSEILRLETQLQLSTQEWTVYSNQLYQELVKEHDQKLVLIEKNNHLNKSHKSLKQSMTGISKSSKRNSHLSFVR